MKDIRRNDPCPCMSGLKYKKCCGISGIWEYFKKDNFNYYNESYILKDIYSQDQKFRHFYNLRRNKISKDVFFIKGHNLRSQMSFGNIEDKAYIIMTREDIISLKNSIHMAHEIEHIVLCSDGYKVAMYIEERFNNLNSRHKHINDMIYDPKVNNTLIDFGFDLVSYLSLSDELQIKSINPNIEEDLFLAMTLCVKRVLDFRNINNNIAFNDIVFNNIIEKNYPNVSEQSKIVLKIVDQNGYSNQKETEKSLTEVIHYLGLSEQLTLKSI